MLTRHKTKQIIADRVVKLVAFTLMPNHFHIILEEHEEGGTVRYMQRLLTAYAKYFATKYNHSGHVFQGPFGATHITDNKQLLYTSAYVHLNPRELSDWEQKEHIYPWSSYQDYISINRWGDLLLTNIITEQFKDIGKYREAVEDSDAKTLNKAVGFPNY